MIKLRKINAFHAFVLAGALVNVVVVLMLLGYWVTH
jgi:predicted nucleic acid-binding Zn ribbon protein